MEEERRGREGREREKKSEDRINERVCGQFWSRKSIIDATICGQAVQHSQECIVERERKRERIAV